MLIFQDRKGTKIELQVFDSERIKDVLIRNNIPCTSVLTVCDGKPISEDSVMQGGKTYTSMLIEGYDLPTIRSLYTTDEKIEAPYIKKRVHFGVDGQLNHEYVPMQIQDIVDMVDSNIEYVIEEYNLIQKGDRVLVGLSGGVDSSSLLIALSKLREKIDFTLIAATFEDFDSLTSPTFANAHQLAEKLKVEHELIPADTVTKTFSLTKNIRDILPEMMNTDYSHCAMYVDHHTTRRALEVFADKINANKIVLGLHTSDIIGGLLNSFLTGYTVGDLYKREIGNYTYIYPLCFVPKKELHLYFYAMMGRYAVHTYPNAWEMKPQDRNYYYYLADVLQTYFPGIENYLFEANRYRLSQSKKLKYVQCRNCHSFILEQDSSMKSEDDCDVCKILRKLGYIK